MKSIFDVKLATMTHVLFLGALVAISTCQPSRSTPSNREFRLVVPDSMTSWKARVMQSFERWAEEDRLPFRLTETAAHAVRLNDSLSYANAHYEVNRNRWIIDGESMEPTRAALFHLKNGDVRVIAPERAGSWMVFGGLRTLVTEFSSFDELIMVYQFGQIIYAAGDSAGVWVERANVFKERALYTNDRHDHLFTFYGPPLDFSMERIGKLLTRFDSLVIAKHPPRIFVYPDYETKARVSANLMEFSFDFAKDEIHLVNNETVRTRFDEIIALFFARKQYGEVYPWLVEGLAFLHAGSYFGRSWEWWQQKRELLSLVDKAGLVGPVETGQNPFLYHLLALNFWRQQDADPAVVLANATRWVDSFTPSISVRQQPVKQREVPFYKGFCFAHSNGIQTGYTSKQSEKSLERIRETGANFVSVTPFGYSADEHSPMIQFVLRNVWDETLGGLFKVAQDAHARGMGVMMKPHLWLGNGKWCGDIDITSESDLRIWEENYSQFIVYHALIAELSGMDALCVGVELPLMTRHTDMWRRIIARVRIAFGGNLTFGGNWFGEYDQIQFWGDLDFIGVQHYFPLAQNPSDSLERARREIASIRNAMRDLSKKWRRPVVLTEVGFPSIDGAFLSPHKEDFSQNVSDERQAEGYQMLIDAFAGEPWFKGFFWWKWESADRDPREHDKSFQIRGKKAEGIVKEFYLSSKRRL